MSGNNTIAIIDYGCSNLTSVVNALQSLNIDVEICTDSQSLKNYKKAILPGVGAFGLAMQQLKERGFSQAIADFVDNGNYILGICLGMQLFLESSEESPGIKGLGIIQGSVESLKSHNIKPHIHMGWNHVTPNNSSLITEGDYYFVHGYFCNIHNKEYVSGQVHCGIHIDIAYEKENIFLVQFHPEKSQHDGLSILKKFAMIGD